MIKAPDRFELTATDKQGALWGRLTKHIEQRIAILRAQNDGDHDEAKTAKLRGAIAECKLLLALGKDDPIIE